MNHLVLTGLTLLLCSGLHQLQLVECSTAEQRERVVSNLISMESSLVRPDGAEGAGSAVMVNLSFAPVRIVDVDVTRGQLKVFGWMMLVWKDRRLSFSKQTNVSSIRIDPSRIWTPDIEVYDSDSAMWSLNRKDLAVVHSTGDVYWVPQVSMTSYCDFLDSGVAANCTLRFGSWTYSGNKVDLAEPGSVDLSAFKANCRWAIAAASVRREQTIYPCCPESYPNVDYSFRLVRRKN